MNKWLKSMLITCISVMFPVNNLLAQEIWEDVTEHLFLNDDENFHQLENLMEDLADLKEHPLPINTATKEQLERFPFLNENLIENILYYIYKYGPMLSEKEYISPMGIQAAAALEAFLEASVEFQVLECGKGVAYDDVNNVPHSYAVINRIFLEHTRELGATLKEIAENKAAIMTGNKNLKLGSIAAEELSEVKTAVEKIRLF